MPLLHFIFDGSYIVAHNTASRTYVLELGWDGMFIKVDGLISPLITLQIREVIR